MRTQRDKLHHKLLLQQLISALDISPDKLSVDPCGHWVIPSNRGSSYIYTDGDQWYAVVETNSEREWSAAKRKLKFMNPLLDCEGEGILNCDRMPDAAEAACVRTVLRWKRRPELSSSVKHSRINNLHPTQTVLYAQ